MNLMSFDQFCQTGPCLEELEGFRDMRMKRKLWTPEDQRDYLVWKDRLERGQEVPAPSRLPRKWKYKRGKKPEKIRKPIGE